MINSTFYPTPKTIVRKMVDKLVNELQSKEVHGEYYILEPSAGKGDILDELKSEYRSMKLFAIEIDPDLQATLDGKGYPVTAYDFLQFKGSIQFDGIIMNPPFANGAQHLLHAWDILNDGVIVCLLNAQTVRNECSLNRTLLGNIIREHGETEMLGQCFQDAERKTQVDIVMVTLRKESNKEEFKFFEDADKTSEKQFRLEEDKEPSEVAIRDVVGNMIIEYDKVREFFTEVFKNFSKIGYHAGHVIQSKYAFEKYLYESVATGDFKSGFNKFSDAFRQDCWDNVFSMATVQNFMTRKVRDDFTKFQQSQKQLDFTKENIQQLFMTIVSNGDQIQQACIEEVFDFFTRYHKDNRIHPEGWKSDKSWMASRKIVLPYIISPWYGDSKYHVDYRRANEINDIDIALNAVTGKRMQEVVTVMQALEKSFEDGCSGLCESTHFSSIRYYKKGTVHLTFREKFTWQEFNMRACKMKGWLPDNK